MSDFSRARGIRFAFLVENNTHSPELLDAIFSLSHGFYGGRFTLIVPCEDGRILPRYWAWLGVYDPDVIYALITVHQTLEREIHEAFCPSYLVEHHEHAESWYTGLRQALPITPLTSLSLLPFAGKLHPFSPISPLKLIDCWPGAPLDRFLLDNFGFQSHSAGHWHRHPSTSNLARPLSLAPDDFRSDPRSGPRDPDDTFSDAAILLERVQQERIVGMAQLSALEARRLEYRRSSWEDVFHIFIGDEYRDRIGFWNARHLQPGWLDQSFVSLRVSPADLNEARFEEALAKFISRRARMALSTGSGTVEVRLISLSLTLDQLEPIRQRLADRDKWNRYTCQTLASLDDCAPTDLELKHATELEGGRYPITAGTPWVPMTRAGNKLYARRNAPQHFELISAEHQELRQGLWAVDCEIERSDNLSRFANVRDVWRLPRRLRIAESFAEPILPSEGFGNRLLVPRVSRSGLLTVFGGHQGVPFEIVEPDDDDAMHRALRDGRRWTTVRHGPHVAVGEIAAFTRISNSGRYVQGLIQLFGGLNKAAEYLLHPFWIARFEELGASVKSHAVIVDSVSNRLKKHQRGSNARSFDLQDPEDCRYLAEIAIKYSSQERRALRYLTFDSFVDRYEKYRDEYNRKYPATESPDREWEMHERATLDRSIQYLCQRGVLHQGYEWTCGRCLHRNWAGIERLDRELKCVICASKQVPTVSGPWAFRLTEFVVHAIRDYGVLPVIWCLRTMQEDARTASFYFLGPTALYYDAGDYDNGTPSAEIDLLVVVDGRVSLCEAKSSDREINAEKLAALALRVRPDEVCIAAMTNATQRLRASLKLVQSKLEHVPIRAKLLAFEDDQEERHGGTWLPGFNEH